MAGLKHETILECKKLITIDITSYLQMPISLKVTLCVWTSHDNRCKTYSSLPSYCHLVPDPADQCCEKVECTAPNGQVLVPQIPSGPTVSPTLSPTIQHVIPVGTHQVFTGSGQPSYPISGAPGTSGTRSKDQFRVDGWIYVFVLQLLIRGSSVKGFWKGLCYWERNISYRVIYCIFCMQYVLSHTVISLYYTST